MLIVVCPDCEAATGGRCFRHRNVPASPWPQLWLTNWCPSWAEVRVVKPALYEREKAKREEAGR